MFISSRKLFLFAAGLTLPCLLAAKPPAKDRDGNKSSVDKGDAEQGGLNVPDWAKMAATVLGLGIPTILGGTWVLYGLAKENLAEKVKQAREEMNGRLATAETESQKRVAAIESESQRRMTAVESEVNRRAAAVENESRLRTELAKAESHNLLASFRLESEKRIGTVEQESLKRIALATKESHDLLATIKYESEKRIASVENEAQKRTSQVLTSIERNADLVIECVYEGLGKVMPPHYIEDARDRSIAKLHASKRAS